MEFYAVRNGHINLEDMKITTTRFNTFFVDVYHYFEEKHYFKLAIEGHHSEPKLLSPSPEAYLFAEAKLKNIWPIEHNYNRPKEDTFTLIEVLHKFIRRIDGFGMYEEKEAQKEFRDMINKYLVCLNEGYLLTESGYIINLPDDGLGNLITQDLPKTADDTDTQKVETAIKMFFRYDSNEDEKMKAINLLADILEPYRVSLKQITTDNHDNLIFQLVNQYGIRHNDLKQKKDYDKPIWYEWMFHYYLSTVHATLKLELVKKLKK